MINKMQKIIRILIQSSRLYLQNAILKYNLLKMQMRCKNKKNFSQIINPVPVIKNLILTKMIIKVFLILSLQQLAKKKFNLYYQKVNLNFKISIFILVIIKFYFFNN